MENLDIYETEIDLNNLPQECYNEEGQLIKTEVAKHLGAFNQSQIDDAVYFFASLINATKNKYYRLEMVDTNFGIVYNYTSNNIQALYRDVLEATFSVVVEMVAAGWANKERTGIEIWGKNKEGEGVILYFYPYDIATVEI